jgi:Skp family chaperone for outer membrane proteins
MCRLTVVKLGILDTGKPRPYTSCNPQRHSPDTKETDNVTKRPSLNALVLGAALFIGAGPYIVKAAGTRPDSAIRANADIQKLYSDSEIRKSIEAKMRQYGAEMFQRFDETMKLRYLTRDELTSYSQALNAETPTEADKKKVTDIKALSEKRVNEQNLLSSKKEGDLTAADRGRLRELANMLPTQAQALEELRQIYQQMVNDEETKETRAGINEVRALVAKLAKEQGVSEVFDSAAMVVAPIDLTPAAAQRLKKK